MECQSIQEVYEITGILKLSTTTYHPQTDDLVENFNRTLRAMVAKYTVKYGKRLGQAFAALVVCVPDKATREYKRILVLPAVWPGCLHPL